MPGENNRWFAWFGVSASDLCFLWRHRGGLSYTL